MVRVLTLLPSAAGGGAERLVLDQMRFHDRNAYKLSVVALRRGPLHDRFGQLPEYSCAGAATTFSPLALRRVHKLIRKERVELLHTHLQEADFYGYLLTRMNPGLVWISTRHNTDEFRKTWFWRNLNRLTSRRLSRVVAVSAAVAAFVQKFERMPREKVAVILNGVDTAPFRSAPSREAARGALRLSSDDFVVGVVGRLTKQKGHAYLLRACALVREQIPNLKLIIAGQGELQGRLERLVAELGLEGRVEFLGYRQDVESLYPAMDVFCLPSVFEGFGLVLIEAMASGCVTIGSRVHGITEVVEHERTGLLVAPEDPNDLAAALLRVHGGGVDPDLTARARAEACTRFDIRRVVKQLEETYLELGARGAPGQPGEAQAAGGLPSLPR